MAKESSPRRIESLSNLGERPKSQTFRTVNLSLYALTFIFGVIYLISSGTDDLDQTGDEDKMKSNVFKYIAVITGLNLILLLMGFFDSYNNTFNIVRLGIMIVLLIFVCITINPIIDLTDSAQTPKDGSGYAIASLTITFAGITSIINLLEVLRKTSI